MSSYSRKRPMAGGATRASIAAAIGARNAAKYPYSDFGRMNVKRGSAFSTRMFGPSYKGASYSQQQGRKLFGYVGRGKYSLPRFMNDVKLVGSGIESAGDRFLKKGLPLMISRAGDVRNFMGKGLYGSQQITGGGAYNMNSAKNSSNQLIAGGRQAPRTLAKNDETDTIILSDCEFVKDIFAPSILSGSSSFASQLVGVNPGLAGFAPNLSQIACNYTEYELQQLVFELRPVISENNVNDGQSGIAMMVFNYNSNDDPFDNKEDVMQAHGSVSGRIVQPITCGVECDPRKTNKTKFFTRTGPVPYLKDNDEYDMGVLTIATNNIPVNFSNKQIYELWVHYKCLLRKRKAGAMRLNNQQRDIFVCSGNALAASVLYKSSSATQFVGGASGVLASQQNNLFCQLSPYTSGAYLNSTSGAQSLRLTFPADFNGFVEVKLTIEASTALVPITDSIIPLIDAASGVTRLPYIGSAYVSPGTTTYNSDLTGNVTLVEDIFASGGVSSDSPSASEIACSATRVIAIFHLRVKSASGGIENTVRLGSVFIGGEVSQWAVDVREITQQHWQNKSTVVAKLINTTDFTAYNV